MLSKKMAFSLTSLITILALALVFVVPSEAQFSTTVERTASNPETVNPETGDRLDIEIMFGTPVTLTAVQTHQITVTVVFDNFSSVIYTIGDGMGGTDVVPVASAGAPAAVGAGALVAAPVPTPAVGFSLLPTDIDLITAGVQSNGQSFTLTIPGGAIPASTAAPLPAAQTVYVTVPEGVPSLNPTDSGDDSLSGPGSTTVNLRDVAGAVPAANLDRTPKVVSIQRLVRGSQTVVAALQEAQISAEDFDVRIVLTEAPNGIDLAAGNAAELLVRVTNASVSNLRIGTPFAAQRQPNVAFAAPLAPTHAERSTTIVPHPIEGMYEYADGVAPHLGLPLTGLAAFDDTVPPTSGPDDVYHEFRVTVTPDQMTGDPFDVMIGVNSFHDNGEPTRLTYVEPSFDLAGDLPNGRDILTVTVIPVPTPDMMAGYRVYLPDGVVIPAGGYLVITKNDAGSSIDIPANQTAAPNAIERTPVQMMYNVVEHADLPNLVNEFQTGVVIDVESPHAGLVISEVMWGEDASFVDPSNSQWIELYNPGAAYTTLANAANTPDIDERTMLVFYGANEFTAVPPVAADGTFPGYVTDRIGSLYGTGRYWSPVLTGAGQSGASGTPIEAATDDLEVTIAPVSVSAIVSMYRVMGAGGTIDAMTGQMPTSWMSSEGPRTANFDPLAVGVRHGTPGAATDAIPALPPPPTPDPPAAVPADVALAGDIMISEIMVDTGGGRLPQWIELVNVSGAEKSLDGWSVQITNSAADEDVIGSSITIDLSGSLGVGGGTDAGGDLGKTLLLVAWEGRHSSNIDEGRFDVVASEVGQKGRYKLISDIAFMIALIPQQETSVLTYGDTAGNLGAAEAWDLPMAENGRSSLIRREILADAAMGTDANSWVLASDTNLVKGPATWYGQDEDAGTPGYAGGGPLPVELSHFRPARDKATGAVVITWATESELNNAGFFIKRSNQRNGQFEVVNATMVAGAGTTSEKQFYTYTDTTAQPNVVYYYQIEDVSLDGNRQTLTRGIRLKGHVGAAGKLTTTWGDLKTSNE